jgi:hypothetical protein
VATAGAGVLLASYLWLEAPRAIIALAAALFVSGVMFGLITRFWKVSIHAASYTGGVAIVATLLHLNLWWLLLGLPVIVWSRYVRKRHDLLQSLVAAGLVIGCITGTLYLVR